MIKKGHGCYYEIIEENFGISMNNEYRDWKHCQKKQPFWKPIYEVIENSYFEETKLFPTILNQCGNNPNEPQSIWNEIKAALKKVATEQGLYAEVVMIRQRESGDKK